MVNTTLVEIGVGAAASTAVSTAVNAEPLLTALISLGVTIVTVVGAELVKFLVAWLQNKRKKLDVEEETKDGEQTRN